MATLRQRKSDRERKEKETQKDVYTMKRGINRPVKVVRNCLMEVGTVTTWDHCGVLA